MNHRIWHFKRTNFDPLALVQKSCCGLLPSVLLFEGVVFFMSPHVSVLLLAWKILLCLEFGWHVDHFSLCSIVLRQKCVIMMSLFGKFKRIVCTEHAHHCSSIFFPEKIHCQHLLYCPLLFLPKRFFSMGLLMFGVKTRSCYFLSLWYFGKQEVKSYCSTYWICQGLSNIFSKVNRNSCGVFKHQKKETRIFRTLRVFVTVWCY